MRWPERATLVVAALIFGVLLLIGNGSPNAGAPDWFGGLIEIVWVVSLKVLLPLWIVLRVLDLALRAGRNRYARL